MRGHLWFPLITPFPLKGMPRPDVKSMTRHDLFEKLKSKNIFLEGKMVITLTLYDLKIEEVTNLATAKILQDQMMSSMLKEAKLNPSRHLATFPVMLKATAQIGALPEADPKKIFDIFQSLEIEVECIKR
jgi:hypothetical protein